MTLELDRTTIFLEQSVIIFRSTRFKPPSLKRNLTFRLRIFLNCRPSIIGPNKGLFNGWSHLQCGTVAPKIGCFPAQHQDKLLLLKIRQQWMYCGCRPNFTHHNFLYWQWDWHTGVVLVYSNPEKGALQYCDDQQGYSTIVVFFSTKNHSNAWLTQPFIYFMFFFQRIQGWLIHSNLTQKDFMNCLWCNIFASCIGSY